MLERLNRRNVRRAKYLSNLLKDNLGEVSFGIEYGTRGGLTTELLLRWHPSLQLITVDNYLRSEEFLTEAIAKIEPYLDRCCLWRMDAMAAGMILANHQADFAHVDVTYHTGWLRAHLPLLTSNVRHGGYLTGSGWDRMHVREVVLELFPNVQGESTLWWLRL
jgi:hypothetical protein